MRKLETTFPSDHRDAVMMSVLRVRARCRMTATDVYFADCSTIHQAHYRGAVYDLPWRVETRLEILVADRDADAVRDALAHSLEVDHGIETVIASSSVDDAFHVPSGHAGDLALEHGGAGVFARHARVVSGRR
jgi:nitrogen regulatory protein PII